MATFVKESTIREMVVDTFHIYGKNLPLLFMICLIPLAPFELLEAFSQSADEPLFAVVGNLLSWFAGAAFAYGATTVAVSDICLGNRPSLKRSYAAVGRVLGRYLGAYLLLLLIIGLGLLLLYLPGILAGTLLVFTLPAVTIERRGSIAALKRSVVLSRGFYWRNFGLLLIMSLVLLAFAGLVYGVGLAAGLAAGMAGEALVFSILLSFIGILLTPLVQIPLILLYYDMRVRKEFFDGAALAQEMFA